MKKPSDEQFQNDDTFSKLIGLGEKSLQKSYYPMLQRKIRELEESEHRYRLLAENISDVIWLLDLECQFQYVSPSIDSMSGFSPEELIGESVEKLLTKDSATEFLFCVNQIIEKAGIPDQNLSEKIELVQVCKDGSRQWLEVVVSIFHHGLKKENRILGVARNITERKQAEHEKTKMQQQLLQAQKMESIGTLTGGIAHDFNNILTIINGYTDIILMKTKKQDPRYKAVASIRKAGRRAERLTKQLLGFSRRQIYTPTVLDINRTISSMEKMLGRLIGEDITVETILKKGIDTVSADRAQIEQIFTNLVINARDALKPVSRKNRNKRITIETGQVEFDSDNAKLANLGNAGSYVFFSVSDNGVGMNDIFKDRIFEPFFTTKAKFEGTGLGLSTVYGIVKQNGGSIRVYSEPDLGTTFKIYWPVYQGDEMKQQQDVLDIDNMKGEETVLIVEDDKDVCTFAANSLRFYGYTVHKAYNGEQALSFLQQTNSRIDLIITDVVMPGMGGEAFAKKAKERLPDVKLIYASGYTDNHIVHSGLLKEKETFLQKPYSQRDLLKKTRNVLGYDKPGAETA